MNEVHDQRWRAVKWCKVGVVGADYVYFMYKKEEMKKFHRVFRCAHLIVLCKHKNIDIGAM